LNMAMTILTPIMCLLMAIATLNIHAKWLYRASWASLVCFIAVAIWTLDHDRPSTWHQSACANDFSGIAFMLSLGLAGLGWMWRSSTSKDNEEAVVFSLSFAHAPSLAFAALLLTVISGPALRMEQRNELAVLNESQSDIIGTVLTRPAPNVESAATLILNANDPG